MAKESGGRSIRSMIRILFPAQDPDVALNEIAKMSQRLQGQN